ncbi:MAG: YihY/virulence factor BrkB family protein [Sphingomonadales bacterium]|nr:YihY/virulence factor BrkB family protein [Sphingomonadales bacterium]
MPGGGADTSPKVARTPEGRRRVARRWQQHLDRHEGDEGERPWQRVGPGSHVWVVAQRVIVGVWQDGFIHAGNLAYMGILALFPFFITVAAIFSALGAGAQGASSAHAFLTALPPMVARTLEPVAVGVMEARHGWLLWVGGVVGLWTVTSLVETIRDILHRAYGVAPGTAFLRNRALSGLMTLAAVVLLLVSLYAQVALASIEQIVALRFPHLHPLGGPMSFTHLVPALVLFGSIYLLFVVLTPAAYRRGGCPMWPGAVLVTLWWGVVSLALPVLLHVVFKYDLTYGSLAGVMIALFFFWLVGLGMVTGAELNAALAQSPEERDMLGQADNRERAGRAGQEQRDLNE